jgi:hypothetical protein
MGVWALASGAIASVLHACQDAEICFLDYHSKPATYEVKYKDGTRLVNLINIRFSWKFWLTNNIARLLLIALFARVFPFQSLHERIISRNQYLQHIQTADIIGSIAGGDSFSDIYGLERLICSSPADPCLASDKPRQRCCRRLSGHSKVHLRRSLPDTSSGELTKSIPVTTIAHQRCKSFSTTVTKR